MPELTPRIGVTLGDPAGIGPEVVARALTALHAEAAPLPRVIGPGSALEQALRQIDSPLTLEQITLTDIPGKLPTPGAPSPTGGKLAIAALDAAVRLIEADQLDALATAPLSKEAVRLGGISGFTGHTEYLQQRAGAEPVRMMMTSPKLTVVLVTTHHALSDVADLIDPDSVFATLHLTRTALSEYMGIARPRIAVCGLNPHPGEFGGEDEARVEPAIACAKGLGMAVEGPFSADALFPRVVHQHSHDAVVAMYHDQGLIPVKLLGMDQAVNVTLGLPYLRTSPAHGTAYDKAGRNQADGSGMLAAIHTARRWSQPKGAAHV